MTQQDKELILKDICARLPYGVMCQYKGSTKGTLYATCYDDLYDIKSGLLFRLTKEDSIIRPYLRPMSSMTEEELKEYHKTFFYHERYDNEHKTGQNCSITFETYDWLNAHHFDYRGLIKKGLALEAPEGMYTGDKFVPITKEELEKTRISSKNYLI